MDDPTATEYLPVPLTPFGVEITSEQPVDREVLSQVTGDFLHAYFEDELPKMGYPHYNNVALSAEQVNRRQRSELEVTQRKVTTSSFHALKGTDQLIIRGILALDLNAFIEVKDMRGGVTAVPEALLTEQAAQCGNG